MYPNDFILRFEQWVLILALIAGLAACNGNLGTTSPVIITQPVNCTAGTNQTATFSVTAIGGGVLSFQWQHAKASSPQAFTDMAGETSSVLDFTALLENDGNVYRAVISNSYGSVTSSAAVLTVNNTPVPAVTVSVSPSATSLQAGDTQRFSASVVNSANLAVIWIVEEGNEGGDIDNAGFYKAPSKAGTYHVVATSVADLTISASATVTVTAPVIVSVSPSTASVKTGETILFTADAVNTDDKAVIWSVQEGNAGGVIDGSGRYTAPDAPGTYHVTAKSAADQSRTATATIQVTSPATVDGIDWWLPEGAKMASYGGLFSQWSWNDKWAKEMLAKPYFKDGKPHLTYMIWASWKSLNPQEGVYNWQSIDSQIARANTDPAIGFSLIITHYKKDLVPEWVLDKGVKTLSNGAVAAWEPGNYTFQNCYRKFIWELAGRYKNNAKLISLDIRGLDVNWGEWGWANDSDGKVWQEGGETTGLSWDAINIWALQHVKDYLEAFKGQEYKLVWPSQLKDLKPTWDYAFKNGVGTRDGFVEAWNLFLKESSGMSQTQDGYLELLPESEYPIFGNGAMSYSENEEYYNTEGYFGPPEYNDIRWFTSCMRVLQLRRNWMMGRDMMYDKFPELTDYMCLSLGKTAKNSPDAWVWLRESYPAGKVLHLFKNFERWLVQRDITPDGVTKTADPIDVSNMGFNNYNNSYKQYEYHARSTDQANGSTYMYFKTDKEYLTGGPHDLIVKVTYKDDAGTKWQFEYTDEFGKTARSATVTGAGSGGWKTATLAFSGIRFDNLFQGMDFRLASMGKNDVTIKMVRIIKSTL